MSRLVRILAWASIAWAVACASPTIPLPPPSVPSVSRTDSSHVTLSSVQGVEANAIVVLYNRNPAVSLQERVTGVQADGQGTWTQTVFATKGDEIDITQEFGNTKSPPVTVEIDQ
ncbi:MAG: hypothetical protein ACRELY_02645 [Polyangiaceae bacterium]